MQLDAVNGRLLLVLPKRFQILERFGRELDLVHSGNYRLVIRFCKGRGDFCAFASRHPPPSGAVWQRVVFRAFQRAQFDVYVERELVPLVGTGAGQKSTWDLISTSDQRKS